MSILDIVEDPKYLVVAVALSADDSAVLINVPKKKQDKVPAALIMAIEMLQQELETNYPGAVMPNNPPTTPKGTKNESVATAS